MFLDARSVAPGATLRASICIIGAGAAGITLARHLMSENVDITLLEGGGLSPDTLSRALYEGDSVGVPYNVATTRTRMFGGSTNCWGGFCALTDASKLSPRPWEPDAEWPIAAQELASHYGRAYEMLGLDPAGFTVEAASGAAGAGAMRALPIGGDRVETAVAQIARQRRRFGKVYRNLLKTARNVSVYLNANVTLIDAHDDGGAIRRVKVATAADRSFWVEADVFVLAAGGIENARLLLLSDNVFPNGIGNQGDAVGRYFAEHATVVAGTLTVDAGSASTRLYDTDYAFNKLSTSLFFQVKDTVQRAEQINHATIGIENRVKGEESVGVEALKQIYLALRQGTLPRRPLRHLANLLRDLPSLAKFLGFYVFGMDRCIAGHTLALVIEQSPNPLSRVTLSADRDRFGLRKARIDWRFTEQDRRTVRRTIEILAEDMAKSGPLRLEPAAEALDGRWAHQPGWAWHHMGTTRMGTDPATSVVDADLRVHGLSNFYVAGSSVFPSAPCHTPTIAIVALSVRLADHIRQAIGKDGVDEPAQAPAQAA